MTDPRERFDEWEQPHIEHGKLTEYNWVVHNPEGLELNKYVDIAAFTIINAHAGVKVESGVQIGPHCDIHSKSTIDRQESPVVIREGAKIGSHTTILPGVEIGRDAVVGSHSVVRDDIPAETLAVGTPAEIKRE
jgi:acetyltransferase-like isoleucine patch superfamily enzyme